MMITLHYPESHLFMNKGVASNIHGHPRLVSIVQLSPVDINKMITSYYLVWFGRMQSSVKVVELVEVGPCWRSRPTQGQDDDITTQMASHKNR